MIKVPHWRRLAPIGVLAFCAFAAATTAASAATRRELSGTSWTLQSVAGAAPVSETRPTLAFGENYRITGEGGCNRFFGVYGVDRGRVAIRDIGATRMSCDAPIMEQEQAFLAILGDARRIEVEDGRLTITGNDGRQVVLTPAP